MNKYALKKIITVLTISAMITGSIITVYAGSIPDAYNNPLYVEDGRVDYQKLHIRYFQAEYAPLTAPTAQFTVTVKHNGSGVSEGVSESGAIIYAQIGDELIIKNTSTLGSGTGWGKCDFQVSTEGSTISTIKTISGMESYKIPTSSEAAYNLSLCIMDNSPLSKTEGWGNWSYNGFKVPGTNPGAGIGSDFPGWWYYAKLTIQVRAPEYSVEEKHIATDSGTVLDTTKHSGITSSSYATCSKAFYGYDFIGSRAGYSWSDIANGTTENIDNRTAIFDSSHINAFHYYYYKKNAPPPLPPPGKADIVVYYKDKASGAAVYPADETTYMGVSYGTYTITALPDTDNYNLDAASTPSPQIVKVDAANNYKEITFLYIPKETPVLRPPVAILNGPLQVMAGEDFNVSASTSYARDDARIVAYNWDINRYTPTRPIDSSDKSITIWSDAVAGDYCNVEVTVVDNNGLSDTARHGIEILPPIPTPVITITGDLRENRKVTLSAASSKTPRHFPLDTTKTKWEITPVSTGRAADIKYSGVLTGITTKDTLYKKAGKYLIKLYVENTAGLSAMTEVEITINPDLPPKSDFSTPATILRNPYDGNNAAAVLTNLSYSPDGDLIWKSAALAVYDSDNNGSFEREICYYSVNGTSWLTTDKTYEQIKSNGFDIFYLTASNQAVYTHKSNQVGKYIYELLIIEGIPEDKTLVEFITNSDYRRNTTWE